MARPLKTRPVRPQDKLSALNAALRHGRMDAAAIAEYCGLSKHSVKSCKFYLPSYGNAESKRYRSWTVLEVLAWLRIPLEQRAEGLASNRVRDAVLREYRAHLEQLNLFDLLEDLRESYENLRCQGVSAADRLDERTISALAERVAAKIQLRVGL